jgi:hypothetical protein
MAICLGLINNYRFKLPVAKKKVIGRIVLNLKMYPFNKKYSYLIHSLIPGTYLCNFIDIEFDIPDVPFSQRISSKNQSDRINLNIQQTEEIFSPLILIRLA